MPELRGQLSGGDGDDTLDGGRHATLQGGLGNDRLTGDPTFGGGTTVSYEDAKTRVRVNLSDARSEGRAREHDVLSGVRDVIGGEGSDVLTGDARGQAIIGNGGRDQIRGGGGNDIVIGGRATDSLGWVPVGMPGGGDRGDVLRGGAGDDVLHGGLGPDHLLGGPGRDILIGAEGPWDIWGLRPRATGDSLHCGAGKDLVQRIETADAVGRDCESVRRRALPDKFLFPDPSL